MDRRVRRVAFPLVDFLLPSTCFCCGSSLGWHQHLGACIDCWTGLRPLPGPVCPQCALPIPDSSDLMGPAGGRCARCVGSVSPLGGVCAAVAYEGYARRFLLRVKLGLRPELLPGMGGLLASRVSQFRQAATSELIVPLPSHPWNRVRRGFWPSLALARAVSRKTGLPVRRRILGYRVPLHPPMKRLDRAARLKLAGRPFRVRGRLDGLRVLLVDDVMTTGTSLAYSARLLRMAGAREVVGAVWARTPSWTGSET